MIDTSISGWLVIKHGNKHVLHKSSVDGECLNATFEYWSVHYWMPASTFNHPSWFLIKQPSFSSETACRILSNKAVLRDKWQTAMEEVVDVIRWSVMVSRNDRAPKGIKKGPKWPLKLWWCPKFPLVDEKRGVWNYPFILQQVNDGADGIPVTDPEIFLPKGHYSLRKVW